MEDFKKWGFEVLMFGFVFSFLGVLIFGGFDFVLWQWPTLIEARAAILVVIVASIVFGTRAWADKG
jgi:hypothetical protein